MSSNSNWYCATLGRVPGVVSLAMLFDFLRCLPRPGLSPPSLSPPGLGGPGLGGPGLGGPGLGGPVGYGRQMIQAGLAAVDAFGPRDWFEALLVMQIPVLQAEADATYALAQRETDWERKARIQRHAMALSRRAEGLGAEVRRHRRELRRGLNLQHVCPQPALAYDLDALEAVWRDPERVLPETALVDLPLEYPAGWGPGEMGMETVGETGVAAGVAVDEAVAAGPDGRLEDRDEFEVEPPPRFQGVPKWKQAGRKYLDEMTQEETAEVVEAQVVRGEVIEEPPQRPEAWSEP